MPSHNDEEKIVSPKDRYADEEVSPLPPLAKDGGVMPIMPLSAPKPLPVASPQNFICLRGPCAHYVELNSIAEVELKADYQPVQINRYCRVVPGVLLDITEDCVFTCNRWDPEDPKDRKHGVESRQKRFLADNPECVKADRERDRKRAEFYAYDESNEGDSDE